MKIESKHTAAITSDMVVPPIMVSDDELSIPSDEVCKVFKEWTSNPDASTAEDVISIHDQDFMDVDEFFEPDLLPLVTDDSCASLVSLQDEPMAVDDESGGNDAHPFSPMPALSLNAQNWQDAPLSPDLEKEQIYRDACASPTGDMMRVQRTVSPPPLSEDEESLEVKIRNASLKLAESMRRSQATRASLTLEPMVKDYENTSEVGSLLSKIEESTSQIQEHLHLKTDTKSDKNEDIKRLLMQIEESTSQLQRRLSGTHVEPPKEEKTQEVVG